VVKARPLSPAQPTYGTKVLLLRPAVGEGRNVPKLEILTLLLEKGGGRESWSNSGLREYLRCSEYDCRQHSSSSSSSSSNSSSSSSSMSSGSSSRMRVSGSRSSRSRSRSQGRERERGRDGRWLSDGTTNAET